MDVSAQTETEFPLLSSLVIFRLSIDWITPTCCGEGGRPSLLGVLIQMLISAGDTLTDTPRSNVLPVISAPLSLSS